MMKNIFILFLFTVGYSTVGLAQGKQVDKPNVIFIITDQWRKQALGYRGEDPVQTPNLDRLAENGFSFDNAMANRPICGPNRACVFTGKYSINNGVWTNPVPIAEDETTFATVFKDAGYKTAYIGKWHLGGLVWNGTKSPHRRGGFDYWIEAFGHSPFSQSYFIPEGTDVRPYERGTWAPTYETRVAMDYIEKNKDNPFCVVLSYNPPHTSGGLGFEDRSQPGGYLKNGEKKFGYGYGGPREYEKMYDTIDYSKNPIRGNMMPVGNNQDPAFDVIPGYFGAITAIDHDIGTLMQYLKKNKLLENTIVVFTSDHGEMMGSHGRMTKGIWFEESVGVPLIISWKGRVINYREKVDLISSIDLMPTLLGLTDLPIPESVDGTNYAPLLLGKKFKAPQYQFSSFDGALTSPKKGRYWRAVNTSRYTYALCGINANRSLTKDGLVLYDKEKDPLQMHPIYRGMGYDEVIDSLHKILTEQMNHYGDPFIEKYWNNPEPGHPRLNQYNLTKQEVVDYQNSR